MARLGDMFIQIRNGANIKQGLDDSGYPITRIETISNRTVDRNKMGYAGINDLSKYRDYILQDGDILMSHINSEKHLAKTALYQKNDGEEVIHGMNLLLLRPNTDCVISKYAFYYFSSQSFLRQIPNITKKSVNQASFTVSALKELSFPSVPLNEQLKIVGVLEKIDTLIEMRKQQLTKLDELVKARFVEMFGETVTNSMGWDTDTVASICSDIYGGGTPSKSHPEYYENGDIPWVSSKDMKTDVLYDSQIKINQLGVDNSTAKIVPVNSVIMVIRSGILKHTLPVAINAVPITVNQDLKVFIPNGKILPTFLMYQFKMLEKDILSGVRAVTADNIEFESLKKRKIVVPPIELQNEFATFVEQVDKSKVAVQKALDEAQTLFDSLMQEYFG